MRDGDSPSMASSRHSSRARVTDCITAFSKAGSRSGSLLSSSELLSIIRLAFLDASLHDTSVKVANLFLSSPQSPVFRRLEWATCKGKHTHHSNKPVAVLQSWKFCAWQLGSMH